MNGVDRIDDVGAAVAALAEDRQVAAEAHSDFRLELGAPLPKHPCSRVGLNIRMQWRGHGLPIGRDGHFPGVAFDSLIGDEKILRVHCVPEIGRQDKFRRRRLAL